MYGVVFFFSSTARCKPAAFKITDRCDTCENVDDDDVEDREIY